MENKKFWICARLAGIGPARLGRLVSAHGSIENVFSLGAEKLKLEGIPDKVASNMEGWEKLPWKEEIELCRKNGLRPVTPSDPEYPARLREIYDPPYILYARGEMPDTDMSLAVVGTRTPSTYGTRMAEKLSMELAYWGFTVVSGLARGIDAAAHRGALKGKGRTVGIIGSGFGHFYPRENLELAGRISESGAVLSEFSFSTKPEPRNFPIRNRIVSGISRAVLVIEAGQKSGALITASCALEQGRDVLAIPGQADNIFSRGGNRLLREGAVLVENVNDIIDSLNLEKKSKKEEGRKETASLTENEKKIMEAVGERKVGIEELSACTGLKAGEISEAILGLALKNLLSELPGKVYARRQK